jgi:hypothetical protein
MYFNIYKTAVLMVYSEFVTDKIMSYLANANVDLSLYDEFY